VLSPSNPGWNHKIEPFALPPLTRIVLADVDAGSDTPSLVGRVLKWRRDHAQEGTSARPLDAFFPRFVRLPIVSLLLQPPRLLTAPRVTADRQWSELRNANADLASVVKRLHDLYGAHPEVYADGVRTAVASSAKRVRLFRFFSHA